MLSYVSSHSHLIAVRGGRAALHHSSQPYTVLCCEKALIVVAAEAVAEAAEAEGRVAIGKGGTNRVVEEANGREGKADANSVVSKAVIGAAVITKRSLGLPRGSGSM